MGASDREIAAGVRCPPPGKTDITPVRSLAGEDRDFVTSLLAGVGQRAAVSDAEKADHGSQRRASKRVWPADASRQNRRTGGAR
jgi:hypothetical protein